jgi:transcriptional regulator with XRE-family HTH domain
MVESKLELGERLRQTREKKDLKQNKVAKILGIHPSTLAKYESGERDPDTDILVRIAELYDESVDWLLTGTYVSTSNSRGFDTELNTDISDLTPEEIDFLNQLKQEVAFKDFLKGPEEQKKSLVDTVKFLMRGMSK